jgi:FlaA1/EpsC-like NDP-sugar epimerase
VKVTHPEARRYFMTISEAVSLLLEAQTRSQGQEIFVLEMGEPVRIVDLAENMIRLAGKVPYEEIDIEFTGLRPGEKVIEELRGETDGAVVTSNEKMYVIRDHPLGWDSVERWIGELSDLLAPSREAQIIAHLQKLVPEFRPAGHVPARPETRVERSGPVPSWSGFGSGAD